LVVAASDVGDCPRKNHPWGDTFYGEKGTLVAKWSRIQLHARGKKECADDERQPAMNMTSSLRMNGEELSGMWLRRSKGIKGL